MFEVDALSRSGLAPVSFVLKAGEALAVRGPSGAGKSLLLRALADLDPSVGLVWLEGRERETIPAPLWRRQVCYIAAEPGWWADLARDHFPDLAEARNLAEEFGLSPQLLDQPVARLSTGERQRLALARGLALHPRVLLLDEPTAALDPNARSLAEAALLRRREGGCALVWVTHDPAQARRVAARLLWVEAGCVREISPDLVEGRESA